METCSFLDEQNKTISNNNFILFVIFFIDFLGMLNSFSKLRNNLFVMKKEEEKKEKGTKLCLMVIAYLASKSKMCGEGSFISPLRK